MHRLDHVAVVVHDLAQARDRYARLGFQLTPQSSHKGRLTPDGPIELWGAGNHCAMFDQGYLEVYGVTNPALYHDHVDAYLAKYPGLHLVAIGCDDADAAREDLAGRLDAVEAIVEVQRDVPYGDSTRLGRFRILHLPDGAFPEADLFFIEHPTRDVLWQPTLLNQPNGVVGLAGVSICTDDPAATTNRLTRILGLQPAADRFPLDGGFVEVVPPRRLTDGPTPPTPFVATAWFDVADIEATARYFTSQGISFDKLDQTVIAVGPGEAEGAALIFRAGDRT